MDFELCVLLWAHPGRESSLDDYETQVLAILAESGGEVVSRLRVEPAASPPTEGAEPPPTEIQHLRFASQATFESFMSDPRRVALAPQRDQAVARTDIHRVNS